MLQRKHHKLTGCSVTAGGLFGAVANGVQGNSWFDKVTKGVVDANGAAAGGVGEEAAKRGSSGGTNYVPSAP